jgi:hypothetical protein
MVRYSKWCDACGLERAEYQIAETVASASFTWSTWCHDAKTANIGSDVIGLRSRVLGGPWEVVR